MVTTTVALGVTVLTLAAFTAIGLWYSRGRVDSAEDFITARNTAGGGMTAATLIASSMGAWILFSPAEAGAAFGGIAAVVGYAVGSALPLLVYTRVGPRVRELIPRGHSLTEYVYARYGSAMYTYVLVLTVFYMFVFLSAEMTGIAGALSFVAGVPAWQTAGLVGAFVLVYTGYGGLVASIFTDTIQTLVILPLLVVSFVAAILSLGGAGRIHENVVATNPQILDPAFGPGLEFGAYVMIAIFGAAMFNQGDWQRIFASRDSGSVRRGFGLAALAVVPLIFLAGMFGIAAAGLGLLADGGDASVAFFVLLGEALPEWLTLVVVLLAVVLVMSTADTLFNALVSIVTADLPRVLEDPEERTLTRVARALTVVVAVAAVVVGAQGYSVLTLFLVADLLAAATFIPYLHGLYSEEATQGGALAASVLGLVVGVAFFPPFRAALAALPALGGVLPASSFLHSFFGAAVVSGVVALAAARVTDGRFDLDSLDREIRGLDEVTADGGRPGADPDCSDHGGSD